MTGRIDLFDTTYSNFETDVLARVRRATFGEDFGQNSWTTADEYRRWAEWLALDGSSHVLEVASGSGGPAAFLSQMSGARVTGVDANVHAVATATQAAAERGLAERLVFQEADANEPLPFEDGAFDALICIDSANHFGDRGGVLKEWYRVLRPGGRLLFTDPVVITGLVSNDELALRSSIGYFIFAPAEVNHRLIADAGFELERWEDVTTDAALIAQRWRDARADDEDALREIEGNERYEGLQRFFDTVHRLTAERRLSRLAYFAHKG